MAPSAPGYARSSARILDRLDQLRSVLAGAPSTRDPGDQRLYVLVPDRERYRNLCRMITASKMRPLNPVEIEQGRAPKYPAKGESRITLDDLERYGAGLICLAGGARSPLALALTRGDDPRALCDRLGAIFGRGNFYIDLGRHLDRRRGAAQSAARRARRGIAASRSSRPTTYAIPAPTARCSTCSPASGSASRWRRRGARYGPTPSAGSNRPPRWPRCFAICPARSPPRVRSPIAASSSSATSATAFRAIRCRPARRPTATCGC